VKDTILRQHDVKVESKEEAQWQVLNVTHLAASIPMLQEKFFTNVITVAAGGVVIMEDKTKDVTVVKKAS
jgi:hypothetical protein